MGDRADAGFDLPDGVDVVYLAVGTGFPDSLGAGPGAALNGAPIIIVPTDPPIPNATAAELERLDPKKVIIIGGTAVISTEMEEEIDDLLPGAGIERIAGADRYETNAMFSAATFPIEGWVSIPAPAFTSPDPEVDDLELATGVFEKNLGVLFAPIHLPHGAEILELKMTGVDDSASNLTADLRRIDYTGAFEVVVALNTLGESGDFSVSSADVSDLRAVVDNETYGYIVFVSNATSLVLQVRNVMVKYRIGVSEG